jgi:hypothetical protein
VSEVMGNIKVASEEQAEGVDQINKAIADMDRITQENSALVEQNTTTSQNMAQEAEKLQELLNTFKVEENDSKSIDDTTEIDKTILKLEQEKFKKLPEKMETGTLPSQQETKKNDTLAPFE